MSDWIVFWAVIALALAVDFAVSKKTSSRRAGLWSAVWIGLGLGFGAWIAMRHGLDAGVTYVTAYLLEESLSVDNLFVFILIFSLTGIPPDLQPRVLFWGIFGALVMRATLIAFGVQVLEHVHWATYPLAALLAYAAYRMLRGEEQQTRLVGKGCTLCSTWLARLMPIHPELEGRKFVVRRDGRWMATPMLVALAVIETTDLVFAVDSIPAVFAVTRDPFLVYTSNIFALLGLRSLYFLLAGVIRELRFLRFGLAVMLLLAAAKLAIGELYYVPPLASLAAIVVIFSVAIAASLLFPATRKAGAQAAKTCTHRDQILDVAPNSNGCEACRKRGERWVALRMCLKCGNVGCCDSSKNRHATAHFHATGHPVMRSVQPGESWKWCYVDRMKLD